MLKHLLGTLAIAAAAGACLPAAASRAVPSSADPRTGMIAGRAPMGQRLPRWMRPASAPPIGLFWTVNCVVCHNQKAADSRARARYRRSRRRPRPRSALGARHPEAAQRRHASAGPPAARPGSCRRRSRPASSRRLTRRRRSGRTRAGPHSIVSIAPSTRTQSGTCSRSTSTPRRCCRPTMPATGSTTSATC